MQINNHCWNTELIDQQIFLWYLSLGESLINAFSHFFVFTLDNSKLINSVKEGNLSKVNDAILKGADINAVDDVSYFHYQFYTYWIR